MMLLPVAMSEYIYSKMWYDMIYIFHSLISGILISMSMSWLWMVLLHNSPASPFLRIPTRWLHNIVVVAM